MSQPPGTSRAADSRSTRRSCRVRPPPNRPHPPHRFRRQPCAETDGTYGGFETMSPPQPRSRGGSRLMNDAVGHPAPHRRFSSHATRRRHVGRNHPRSGKLAGKDDRKASASRPDVHDERTCVLVDSGQRLPTRARLMARNQHVRRDLSRGPRTLRSRDVEIASRRVRLATTCS